MDRVEDSNTDSEKRGKLLFLAAAISLAIFLTKVLQGESEIITWKVYLDGAIYFVIAFVGLLWAFNFQVKLKSILYILQSSLFVLSEVLFVQYFFFEKFSRIYEALILLLVLILVFIGSYVSFLMANVLNVDLFKKLPLAQVGRTSSYLISLLSLYFLTFSLLSSNFPLYILLPAIILIYSGIVIIHFMNIGMEQGELFRKSFLMILTIFILFLGVFLSGNTHELTAIVPALGYYFGVSMVSQEQIFRKGSSSLPLSMIFMAVIFFSIVILNIVLS